MLNFTLISSGECSRQKEYVTALRHHLNSLIKNHGFLIYNLNADLETNDKILQKGSRLILPTKKEVCSEYWGIKKDADIYKYRSLWCDSHLDYYVPSKSEFYYNKSNLNNLIKEWKENGKFEDDPLYDLGIEYQYIQLSNGTVTILELYINEISTNEMYTEIFKNLIIELERDFSDVLLSAYITNNLKNLKEEFNQSYRYDRDLLNSKILDTGYMMYISESIKNTNNFDDKQIENQYHSKLLTNGTLYTYIDGYNSFVGNKESVDLLFKEMIIPKYELFNWSSLCNFKSFPIYRYDMISVCYSNNIFDNEACLLFSFGCTYEQINDIIMVRDMHCQERYAIKK